MTWFVHNGRKLINRLPWRYERVIVNIVSRGGKKALFEAVSWNEIRVIKIHIEQLIEFR
jgi:hypothetical protein